LYIALHSKRTMWQLIGKTRSNNFGGFLQNYCSCHLIVCIDASRCHVSKCQLWSLYARKKVSSKLSFFRMYFKLWMWVWVVSFEHSFHNCQALLKRTLYFQNPKMKLVLSIYSCWSYFVFLLMVLFFFNYIFKGALLCWDSKTKLVLNYSHLSFHVLLFLKAIKCLMYYLACNEGMCIMFIKTTYGLCTFRSVALGSSRMGVNMTKVFYFIKDLH
jgi:hypothetical protein